jgi:rubrerythrin
LRSFKPFLQENAMDGQGLTSLKCSTTADSSSVCSTASIWQDVLAQAVTGELIAVLNYTSLAEICADPDEMNDALEHAASEQAHAAAFTAEGQKLGIEVPSNVNAKYWKRLRAAFLRQIEARDFIGCLIIQEVMLESFAVASYKRVGQVAPGTLGRTFAAIAAEEEDHIDHAMSILKTERALDNARFDEGASAPRGSHDDAGPDVRKRRCGRSLRALQWKLRQAIVTRGGPQQLRTSRCFSAALSQDA